MGCHPDDYSKLTAVIKACFPGSGNVVGVSHAPDGVNAGCHFVVSTSDSEKFGLKVFDQTHTVNGVEKELLMYKLANAVAAPNACAVSQTANVAFIPEFGSRTVNVSRWLKDAYSIRAMPTAMREELKTGGEDFFSQLGEWIAFGLVFGVTDRNDGNWVWNHSEKRLSMIDMEYCLGVASPGVYNAPTQAFLGPTPEVRKKQMDSLTEGFTTMLEKAKRSKDALQALLDAHPAASQGYSMAYLDNTAEEMIVPFVNAFL